VEALVVIIVFLIRRSIGTGSPLDSGHHFCDQHQVDDEGRGEEGVFTDVEDAIYMRYVCQYVVGVG